MIKGMTGFGRQEFNCQGVKGMVEIKSLNNRYFDLVCHLPTGFNAFEEQIKKILESKIKRGRITVVINLLQKPTPRLVLNRTLAREYLLSLKKLSQLLKIKQDISSVELLKLPGIFSLEETQVAAHLLWLKIEPVFKKAAAGLMKHRAKEGRFLLRDILQHAKEIRSTLKEMRRKAEAFIRRKAKLLEPEELASFLKSSDINEEITRLNFHLNSLQERMNANDSVGKELDFICQELLREVNTSGAKLADKEVASCAIKIKSDIEKIREQVQNVE